MAEYFDRKLLLDEICRDNCEKEYDGECRNCRITQMIDKLPGADVAPVVHGEWIKEVYVDPYGGEWVRFKCNLCGRIEVVKEPYCNCGAKMDGYNGEENEIRECDNK